MQSVWPAQNVHLCPAGLAGFFTTVGDWAGQDPCASDERAMNGVVIFHTFGALSLPVGLRERPWPHCLWLWAPGLGDNWGMAVLGRQGGVGKDSKFGTA